MYFGIERHFTEGGSEIEGTHCAVNNVYLNGVRVAVVAPNGDAQYYLTDQVDSVKFVVNDLGIPVNRMEYLPYGETWFAEGEQNHSPKYNSQELDKESGFYFYNARHYDPEIARFVTADNVIDGEGDPLGWNRFMYCHGNPIVYKDPTGHRGLLGGAFMQADIQLWKGDYQGSLKTRSAWAKACIYAADIESSGLTEAIRKGDKKGIAIATLKIAFDVMPTGKVKWLKKVKTGGQYAMILATAGKSGYDYYNKLKSTINKGNYSDKKKKSLLTNAKILTGLHITAKIGVEMASKKAGKKWFEKKVHETTDIGKKYISKLESINKGYSIPRGVSGDDWKEVALIGKKIGIMNNVIRGQASKYLGKGMDELFEAAGLIGDKE